MRSTRFALLTGVFVWSTALAAALVFLVLQGRRALFVEIDMETSGPAPVVGEVWWSAGARPFHPSDSTSFRAGPGRQSVSVRVPVEIDILQIRPASTRDTSVAIRGIALRTPVATLRRWGGTSGFAGWRETGGLRNFRVADGVLRLEVRETDGAFQVDDVRPLREGARRAAHARLALAAGLLAGLVQTIALALLALPRDSTGRPALVAESRGAPKGAWWLFAGTTAVCLVLAWFAGRALLRRAPPPVFADTGEYSLEFVDHLGRRLSERAGGLKLALDAHSFYRNAPGQNSSRFTIDAHGYRGGFDDADPRPRVLVLGGSAAFGFGLDSDRDVFTARLGRRQPGWQVVNASVVGHLSGQELSELVHHGDEVGPAAVVVFDGWNDLYVPLLAATRFPAASLGVGFNWDVFHLVESRLRLLTLGGAADDPGAKTLEEVPDLVRRITAAYETNLARMNQVATARGASLLVVFQPWLATRRSPRPDAETRILKDWTSVGDRADPAHYDALLAEVRRFLTANGIAFVDLHTSGAFVESPRALFSDVVHMVPDGHELVARELEGPLGTLMGSSPKRPGASNTR